MTAPALGQAPESAAAVRTKQAMGYALIVSGIGLAALVLERSLRAQDEVVLLTAPLPNALAALGARALVSLAGVYCALRLIRTGERLIESGSPSRSPPPS